MSWYSFRERLSRAGLVACVLALMVALLGCLYSVARTVANTADALAEATGTTLQVMPRSWLSDGDSTGSVGIPLNQEQLAALRELPLVEDASPRILGRGLIAMRADGTPYVPALASTQSGSFEETDLGRLALIAGRAPTNVGEVVIDAVTLRELGHVLGDEVLLIHDQSSKTLTATVVGVVEVAGANPGASSFVLLSPEQAQQVFLGGQQGWNAISLTLSAGADVNAVAGSVNALLPYGYFTANSSAIDNAHRFWLHPPLTGTLAALVVIGLIAVLSTIALTNTVFGRLARHQREAIVSLRVMGASRLLTWKMVMGEGLLVAVTGSLAGVLLAALFQGLAHDVLAHAGMPIGAPSPGIGFDGAAVVFVIGVVCSLLAANQHAFAAIRAYPINTRRYSSATRWLGEEAWSGVGLILVAFVLIIAQRLGALPVPLLWALIASLALVAGCNVVCSMLGRPGFSRLTARIPGLLGALSRVTAHHATQRPHRLAVGIAMLVLSAAVLAASGVVSASGMATAQRGIPASFNATQVFTNVRGHNFSPDLTEFIAAQDSVSSVSAVGIYHANVEDKPLTLAIADPDAFETVFSTEVVAGRAPGKSSEVMVSTDWARENSVALDDLFRFTHGRQRIALRVVGLFEVAGELDPADAVATRQALTERGIDNADNWVAITLSSPAAAEKLNAALGPVLKANPLLTLTTPEALGQLQAQELAAQFRPWGEVFRITMVAGAFGLALLLALSVLDRRRDYGALRMIGASPEHLSAMVLAEGVLLAAFGILLGVVSGTISGWTIQHALIDAGYSTLVTPLSTSLLPLLLAIPVGATAALPAAVLVRNSKPRDSLPEN